MREKTTGWRKIVARYTCCWGIGYKMYKELKKLSNAKTNRLIIQNGYGTQHRTYKKKNAVDY